MKNIIIFIAAFFFFSAHIFGQAFNPGINKDSLLNEIIKKLPEERKSDILNTYKEGNAQTKEFLLFMLSMPTSSKKELVANIDSNLSKINYLKKEYEKLVPKNYEVSIEFNPAEKIVITDESIDICIVNKSNKQAEIKQEWGLKNNTEALMQMIKPLGWTNETIKNIQQLLKEANCVSIENGKITTIGFARSGMGKYSFKLFDHNLKKEEELKEYNNGCSYIFYKDNIVLEYGGGAIGPQCFPERQD